MICSSLEKDSLFLNSSQAAVTDTTSGLMLFSCSSNCSLNRIAWSRGIRRFTLDIWRKKRKKGDVETFSWYDCCHIDCVCGWLCVYVWDWRGFYPLLTSSTVEQSSQCLTEWTFLCLIYWQQNDCIIEFQYFLCFIYHDTDYPAIFVASHYQVSCKFCNIISKKEIVFCVFSFVCVSSPLLQTAQTQPGHRIHPSSLPGHSAARVVVVVWPGSTWK